MAEKTNEIKPKLSQQKSFKYFCEKCDYGTCKKSNYDNHLLSAKHTQTNDTNGFSPNLGKNKPKISRQHICMCGNKYLHLPSLYKHKKNCKTYQIEKDKENIRRLNESGIEPENEDNDTEVVSSIIKEEVSFFCDKDLIMMLIKQNAELMELLKAGTNSHNHSHNTTHTNSHNKAFNLNFFLHP